MLPVFQSIDDVCNVVVSDELVLALLEGRPLYLHVFQREKTLI
jgi:hypothetical protein